MNKVVARLADGRLIKGTTVDFLPNRDTFHVRPVNGSVEILAEIHIKDLKALFFVKDFEGDPKHVTTNEFDPEHPVAGRKLKVVFRDGEVLVGTTTGYQPDRPGFFLIPADGGANTKRCYVVAAATQEVSFL